MLCNKYQRHSSLNLVSQQLKLCNIFIFGMAYLKFVNSDFSLVIRAFTLAKLSHKYSSNFGAKLSHKLKTDVHTGQIEKFSIDYKIR